MYFLIQKVRKINTNIKFYEEWWISLEELKPCPFCGSKVEKITYEENRIYQTICDNCETVFTFHRTSQFAAEREWNERMWLECTIHGNWKININKAK